MNQPHIKVYPYRWVILALYVFITIVIEIQWLTFASISSVAQDFYSTSAIRIDFLSMVYMLVFIIMSIPASYILDAYGLRRGLAIGASLTGIFSLLKAYGADNLLLVTVAQGGLAFAQPFILNALTKVGAQWFPVQERATVAGFGALAQYLGIIIALAITPVLIHKDGSSGYGIQQMLWVYGIISFVASVLLLVFLKEGPPSPPASGDFTHRLHPLAGLKEVFRNRDMKYLLLLFFIGLGIFNAVSTCIDQVCKELTVDQTGMVGGVMLFGGVLGALILPWLSDKKMKRKPFLVACIILMLPGLLGLTFFSAFVPLMISSFVFGFFIMSAGPIGFQYGAEVSHPVPESTSQGIILLTGQISGILFVVGVNLIGVLITMLAFVFLTAFNVFVSSRLRESTGRFAKDYQG